MPIADTDIKLKYSIKTGTAGNQSSQSDPNASLGKYIATNEIPDNTLNNLFDDISGDENAAEESEYRCVFYHNAHASLTYKNPVVWIFAELSGGADTNIGLDTTAASAIGSSSAQALEVADEDTAPSGVSFSAPTSKATGLSLSNLSAGYCRAIWIKRTATNSEAKSDDGVTIKIEGETDA